MFSRFLRRSYGKCRDIGKAGVGVRRLRSRLLVEALEDRRVLSVFNVNSTADILYPPGGVVTLRSALEMANEVPGNNTINLTVPGTYKIAISGASQHEIATSEFAIVSNAAGPIGSTLTIQNTSGGKVIVEGNPIDLAGNSAPVRPDSGSDAVPLWFTSMLDNTKQVPSNNSPATGNATVPHSPDQTTLGFVILESSPVVTISRNVDSGYGEQEVSNNSTVNPAPVITLGTMSLNLGTTTAGTAGMAQSYAVSGSNLTAAIIVTAPMGVELSSDNGRSFHPLVTLTPAIGTVATTTIEARISASAKGGTIRGKIRYTSSGGREQELSVSGTVNPRPTTTPSTKRKKPFGASSKSVDLDTSGKAKSYTISRSKLTAAIVVTAPRAAVPSSYNGNTLDPSLRLTPANGTVATDADDANMALANLRQDDGTGDRSAGFPAIITEVFLAIAIRANAGSALPDSKSGPATARSRRSTSL